MIHQLKIQTMRQDEMIDIQMVIMQKGKLLLGRWQGIFSANLADRANGSVL